MNQCVLIKNHTYLTIPNPMLTMITRILANVRFRQEINSANTTRPFAINNKMIMTSSVKAT